MGVFNIKHRDTLPVLEVELLEPDPALPGEFRAHDLTGSTAWYLHILQDDGTVLRRPMTVQGAATLGILRYAWVAGDWSAGSSGAGTEADPYTAGGLIEGQHRMEYEVLGPASARMTFPNGGRPASNAYDRLSVVADLGQGS